MKPLLVWLVLFSCVSLAYTKVQISIDPALIGLRESATVQIISDEKLQRLAPPEEQKNLRINYSGESRSSSFTIINGRASAQTSFVYTFVVGAEAPGKYKIGPFRYQIKAGALETETVTLTVSKQARQQKAPDRNDPFAFIEEMTRGPKLPEIRTILKVRPERVNINEQVILEVVLLSDTREAMDYQYQEVRPLSTGKISWTDISSTIEPGTRQVTEGYSRTLKRYVCFPIESGKLGIEPPAFIGVTPFGQMEIPRQNIGLEVIPPQDPTPGLRYYGVLNGTARVTPVSNAASADLEIVLTGNGNLNTLANPYEGLKIVGLNWSHPSTDLKLKEYRNGEARFELTSRYHITAERNGSYTIPELSIPTEYRGKKSLFRLPALRFDISGGKSAGSGIELPAAEKTHSVFTLFQNTSAFALLFIILILLPLGAYLYSLWKEKLAEDPVFARKTFSDQMLEEATTAAISSVKTGDLKSCCSELRRIMLDYPASRLGLPEGTSASGLEEALNRKGKKQLWNEWKKRFDDINRMLYSGSMDEKKAGSPEPAQIAEFLKKNFRSLK